MVFRILFLSFFLTLLGCYSFKGISIAPTINSFYIEQFQNSAFNAPPDIGVQFSEELKGLVLSSTRLQYDDVNPNIEFKGAVRTFNVSSVAPQQTDDGFGSSLNRLSISVEVEFLNYDNEDENWKQSFSFFQDYESTDDLTDVQDELIEIIFDQINQDIFNKAFTNW